MSAPLQESLDQVLSGVRVLWPALAMQCPLELRPALQAAERAKAEAASLEEQLALSASKLACLQQQHQDMEKSLEAAAAQEVDLIRRREEMEAGRQAAGAEQEAVATALRQDQAAAAKVCSRLGYVYNEFFLCAMPLVGEMECYLALLLC